MRVAWAWQVSRGNAKHRAGYATGECLRVRVRSTEVAMGFAIKLPVMAMAWFGPARTLSPRPGS